jgi:hypothetical protein
LHISIRDATAGEERRRVIALLKEFDGAMTSTLITQFNRTDLLQANQYRVWAHRYLESIQRDPSRVQDLFDAIGPGSSVSQLPMTLPETESGFNIPIAPPAPGGPSNDLGIQDTVWRDLQADLGSRMSRGERGPTILYSLSRQIIDHIFEHIADTESFIDPVSGLKLPPDPRAVPFADRPRAGAVGRKMSFEEYLSDPDIGWGAYTAQHMLTTAWLRSCDRNIHQAVTYHIRTSAVEHGIDPADKSAMRERHNATFFALGIFTPLHLNSPPAGYERQAKILKLATKIANPLPVGYSVT